MLLFVALCVHHVRVLALVDSGSEVTLISPSLVNLLKLRVNRTIRGTATHYYPTPCSAFRQVSQTPPPDTDPLLVDRRRQKQPGCVTGTDRKGAEKRKEEEFDSPPLLREIRGTFAVSPSRIVGRVEDLLVRFFGFHVGGENTKGYEERNISVLTKEDVRRRSADEESESNCFSGSNSLTTSKCFLPIVCDAFVLGDSFVSTLPCVTSPPAYSSSTAARSAKLDIHSSSSSENFPSFSRSYPVTSFRTAPASSGSAVSSSSPGLLCASCACCSTCRDTVEGGSGSITSRDTPLQSTHCPASPSFPFVIGVDSLVALEAVLDVAGKRLILCHGTFVAPLIPLPSNTAVQLSGEEFPMDFL
ncbi:hypothetical protein CSUI_000136 [Cystoisospora suis]|uniref:Uncharacterized protein n=1 Tax=Cystoisospora suis TaxID=483139 RepID=A0A2C6LF57_9APIC|nr:hypothetical protein CSUI_000136 [Cystoisospora suis]